MLFDDHALRVFSSLHRLLDTCQIPPRQIPIYERVLTRVADVAARSEVFLPVDLPLAVAATLDVDDESSLRAAAVATLLWAGADLMDDAADGDLVIEDWGVQPHQLALVYTNLLTTLPHLVAGGRGGADFNRRLAEALWLMSHGQFTDLESASAVHTTRDYLDVVAHKTGVEAGFFAAAPLLLAGAPRGDCEAWEAFGFHIGCMLQLFSDIHGTFTEHAGNDLLDGKRTLPVVYTLENLTPAERAAFVAELDCAASGAQHLLPALFERMHHCGAARYALGEVERFRFRAAAALPVVPGRVARDHPLRRLLRSCSVLHELTTTPPRLRPPQALTAEPARVPESDPERASMPGSRTIDASHADRVANYYDTHTEPFYLNLWDADDIHFGLFDDSFTALRPALKAMTRAIVEPAGIRPGEFVLDAGCGVGGAAIDIARGYGVRVLGLTVSRRQVEIARLRAAAAGVADQAEFAVADCAKRLPLDDACVDVVLTIEAACHFADKAQFLRECHRVLRPGGRLVGSDWMRTTHATDAAAQAALMAVEDAWHLAGLYSPAEWQALLIQSGFDRPCVEDFGARVRRNAQLLVHARLDLLLEIAAAGTTQASDKLWLEQYATLCQAWAAGWFTVARVQASRR